MPHVDAAGSSHRSRRRGGPRESPQPPLFRIGRSVIRPRSPSLQPGVGKSDEPERPVGLVIHDRVQSEDETHGGLQSV